MSRAQGGKGGADELGGSNPCGGRDKSWYFHVRRSTSGCRGVNHKKVQIPDEGRQSRLRSSRTVFRLTPRLFSTIITQIRSPTTV